MPRRKRKTTTQRIASTRPPDSEQQRLAEWLRAARDGEESLRWLDVLCRRAGYVAVQGRRDGDVVLVTARQLAAGLGVTERTVRNWLKEDMPVYQHSLGNRPALYEVFSVLAWHYGRQMPKAKSEEEILFGDGKSNDYWTTQYRKEATRKIKRGNELAEGTLLRTDDIAEQLTAIALVFRSEAEAIERAHGHDVGKDVRQMIVRAEARWREITGKEMEDGKV